LNGIASIWIGDIVLASAAAYSSQMRLREVRKVREVERPPLSALSAVLFKDSRVAQIVAEREGPGSGPRAEFGLKPVQETRSPVATARSISCLALSMRSYSSRAVIARYLSMRVFRRGVAKPGPWFMLAKLITRTATRDGGKQTVFCNTGDFYIVFQDPSTELPIGPSQMALKAKRAAASEVASSSSMIAGSAGSAECCSPTPFPHFPHFSQCHPGKAED
jgi:hypothetical protein